MGKIKNMEAKKKAAHVFTCVSLACLKAGVPSSISIYANITKKILIMESNDHTYMRRNV